MTDKIHFWGSKTYPKTWVVRHIDGIICDKCCMEFERGECFILCHQGPGQFYCPEHMKNHVKRMEITSDRSEHRDSVVFILDENTDTKYYKPQDNKCNVVRSNNDQMPTS